MTLLWIIIGVGNNFNKSNTKEPFPLNCKSKKGINTIINIRGKNLVKNDFLLLSADKWHIHHLMLKFNNNYLVPNM